jgi:hypothetical protein
MAYRFANWVNRFICGRTHGGACHANQRIDIAEEISRPGGRFVARMQQFRGAAAQKKSVTQINGL